MPVVRSTEAVVHEIHGARFLSYARQETGSTALRAWRLEIPAGTEGVEHTVSHEEVLLLLTGTPVVTLDGAATAPDPTDAVIVPAGTRLKVDNPGPGPVTAWVTTSAGLQATLPDGTTITPPWAG
ncbi:cupin domain-containing protein [Kitasatospora camelliae]|uniref:Cupin domain-containing protein n=1 Tax=Kitasatospora camelliae TaxID=3156397 RepID=A0AAU8JTA6_9ACTN